MGYWLSMRKDPYCVMRLLFISITLILPFRLDGSSNQVGAIDPKILDKMSLLSRKILPLVILEPIEKNGNAFVASKERALQFGSFEGSRRVEDNSRGSSQKPKDRSMAIAEVPVIMNHSSQQIEITAGNRVQLEINLKGTDVSTKFNWTRNGDSICKQAKCLLSTRSWSVGVHRIRAQIFNTHGALYLEFRVIVRFRLPDKKNRLIAPPLVTYSGKNNLLTSSNAYIRAIQGNGYRRFKERSDIIDEFALPLYGRETISTSSNGVLHWGVPRKFEHYVFPRSILNLGQDTDVSFNMTLKEGLVRSRNLNANQYHWDISPYKGIIVDGDDKSDIVVITRKVKGHRKRSEKGQSTAVKIFCIRGVCRLRSQNDALNKLLESSKALSIRLLKEAGAYVQKQDTVELYLTAGRSVYLWIGKNPKIVVSTPSSRSLSKIIELSTPSYQNLLSLKSSGSWNPSGSSSQQYYHGGFRPLSEKLSFEGKMAPKQLEKYIEESDYLMILEMLSQFPKSYYQNNRFQVLLGVTYLALHDYERALGYLEKSLEASPEPDWLNYCLGILSLLKKDYETALRYFGDIENGLDGFLSYYMGVAEYFEGDLSKAKFHFHSSQWINTNEAIERSTQEFLNLIEIREGFRTYVELTAFYDSNVVGGYRDDPEISSLLLKKISSYGVSLGSRIEDRLMTSEEASVKYGIDIKKFFLADKDLNPFEPYHLRLYTEFDGSFGDHVKKILNINIDTFIWRTGYGSQSLTDGFGVDFGVGLPHLIWSPMLHYVNDQYLDPQPDSLKIIDPFLNEPVGHMDLAGRFLKYGLSLYFSQSEEVSINSRFDYVIHKRRNMNFKDKSYLGPEFKIDYARRFSSRWRIYSGFAYMKRNFESDSSNRIDNRVVVFGKGSWNYRPHASLGLHIQHRKNQSSREFSNYSKTLIGSSYQFEF